MKIETFYSDDYAGCSMKHPLLGEFEFYYGYERTYCPKCDLGKDCECDEVEWCFVAERKNNKEILRLSTSEIEKQVDEYSQLETPQDFLIAGVMLFLSQHDFNK